MKLKNTLTLKNSLTIINIILLTGLIISFQTVLSLNKKINEAAEAARPANLNIIVLKTANCEDCSDMTPLINAIKKKNVKINSERTVDISDPEGIKLINQYGIKKAPTLIIGGELQKETSLKTMWQQLGEIKDNTFILRQVGFPYVLTDSGEVKGRVKLIMITDDACKECYDVKKHKQILKQFNLPIQNEQIIGSRSADGKKLIAEYKIKLLPTIILTGDVGTYQELTKIWSKIGTIEKNGAYVFRDGVKRMGIYKNLTTNKIITPTADSKNKSGK